MLVTPRPQLCFALASRMSAPRHSWEIPAWDDDGSDDEEPWGGGSCSDEYCDDEAQMTAGAEFMRIMISLVLSRALNNRQFCEVCFFAGRAGVTEAVPYGMRPGCSSGNYSRRLDPLLGFKRANASLYELEAPGHSKNTLSRVTISIPVIPPHEAFDDDVVGGASFRPKLAEMLDGPMPPTYTDHPAVQGAVEDELVVPLALYADAVPYSNTDSVLGFWVVNLVTEKRYLCAALRKRLCCKCGCKGWCTFWAVFDWLAWSFKAITDRSYPAQRHDGKPWTPQDTMRQSRAGQPLRLRGAMVYIKGDWAEYNTTMGFPSWQDALRPCFECNAFQQNMYQFSRVSSVDQPWRNNVDGDYEAACTRCEIRV